LSEKGSWYGNVTKSAARARPIGAAELSDFPEVYDAAFSWDRAQEARTYLHVAATLSGKAPRSAVELGCGSGPLARLWARWGLEVYGVDRSGPALARARSQSHGLVPPGHWVLGTLQDFRLPRRVGLIVVPLDGLGYLVDGSDLVSFFRAARRSLGPGGVLAIDLTLHPSRGRPLPIRSAWRVGLRPNGLLRVSWRSHGRSWGTPPRRWEVGQVTVAMPGGRPRVFWESAPHAILTARALGRIAQDAGGFGKMVVYSDAAHRTEGARLRRLASPSRVHGSRLVCWLRTTAPG
jgi:SAM-dependent methyltransferase